MDHTDQPLNDYPPQANQTKPGLGTSCISRRAVLIGASGLIGGGLCIGASMAASMAASSIVGSLPLPSQSSGKPFSTYDAPPQGFVDSIAWSPDGTRVTLAGSSMRVWNPFNGTDAFFTCPDATNQPISLSSSVAWSPDGQFIAASVKSRNNIDSLASINTVQIWKASTGEPIFMYHASDGCTVVWSPDGNPITSTDQFVQVWKDSHGNIAYADFRDDSVAWSPNGKRLAFVPSGSYDIESWDASDGKNRISYSPGDAAGTHRIAWSRDSQYLACAEGGAVEIWKASNGRHLVTYDVHGVGLGDYYSLVYDLAWSPDGRRLASASDDKTVEVCDALSGKHIFAYTGHSNTVKAVAWSPNGKYIASASTDGTVQVWIPG